jgi:hypothetical protein
MSWHQSDSRAQTMEVFIELETKFKIFRIFFLDF